MPIAGPLLECEAFKRLRLTTFLGVLSPKFDGLVRAPVTFTGTPDGSRRDHSIGVAALLLDICDSLSLSQESCRYAVAWGLIHDIATWPLSHTGEAAFTEILGVDARTLRMQMIEGSKKLPSSLRLNKALSAVGIDKNVLISLLDSKKPAQQKNLQKIWSIIHSPITPDTLEGIWRTGRVFGVDVPNPPIVASAIDNSLLGPVILKTKSRPILLFWRCKAEIYGKIINCKKIITWESRWSFSIAHYFKHIDLEQSLYLDEEEIIKSVLDQDLLKVTTVQRYKSPLKYSLYGLDRKRELPANHPLDYLHQILKKEKIKGDPCIE